VLSKAPKRILVVLDITIKGSRLSLVQGDITICDTDAIVNAANSGLMGGGGVDGAIHRAGGPAILEACRQYVAKFGRLPTGQAMITAGGNLKAKYVIHTVGPVWYGGNQNEASLLASAYLESLQLAENHKLTSISFPSISTGAYGYPVDLASAIALKTVASFLQRSNRSVQNVVFVLFDSRTFQAYQKPLQEVSQKSA
jgi:O-acetyl-ADP-ribose deacetylase (regulator of RNase III)